MPAAAAPLVLITGGSSGIGLELARQYAHAGACLCLVARRPDVLAQAAQEVQSLCRNADQKVYSLSLDISKRADVLEKLSAFQASVGTPDILINNAGNVQPAEAVNAQLDDYEAMIQSNYLGAVYVTKAFLPAMIARGSGRIVNISSMAGRVAIYGYTGYGASKFALRGLGEALRSELKPLGIQVSNVYPADTDTPQLAYESRYKPHVTKVLAGTANVMSPQAAVRQIITGVNKGKGTIIIGFESQLFDRLHAVAPGLFNWIMDGIIARALRGLPQSGTK